MCNETFFLSKRGRNTKSRFVVSVVTPCEEWAEVGEGHPGQWQLSAEVLHGSHVSRLSQVCIKVTFNFIDRTDFINTQSSYVSVDEQFLK